MNDKVEVLKAEYSIIRDKLFLFSAGAGGSFTMLVKDNLFTSLNLFVGAISLACGIGILTNLYKAGKIQKELETLKGLTNG